MQRKLTISPSRLKLITFSLPPTPSHPHPSIFSFNSIRLFREQFFSYSEDHLRDFLSYQLNFSTISRRFQDDSWKIGKRNEMRREIFKIFLFNCHSKCTTSPHRIREKLPKTFLAWLKLGGDKKGEFKKSDNLSSKFQSSFWVLTRSANFETTRNKKFLVFIVVFVEEKRGVREQMSGSLTLFVTSEQKQRVLRNNQ